MLKLLCRELRHDTKSRLQYTYNIYNKEIGYIISGFIVFVGNLDELSQIGLPTGHCVKAIFQCQEPCQDINSSLAQLSVLHTQEPSERAKPSREVNINHRPKSDVKSDYHLARDKISSYGP